MADDGLLINFSVKDAPINSRTLFKGGRWKDRLKAKRSSLRRTRERPPRGPGDRKTVIPAQEQKDSDQENMSPPTKRPKLNPQPRHGSQTAKAKPDIVSSLFTFNPIAKDHTRDSMSDNDVRVSPSNAPLPEGASNFTALGVNSILATHLSTSLQLKAPTAIQKAAISQLLKEDSDAFIQAETGSGKTLAYLLPIIQRLMSLKIQGKGAKINRKAGLFALILAPTRELAKQIDETLTSLLNRLPWLVHGTVFGGTTKNHEKARIRKGINILVATPGRLIDHLENTVALDVGSIRWMVLDEGDRLVELGFEEDVKKIVEALETKKRTERRRKNQNATDGEEKDSADAGKGPIVDLPKKRTTVLCSATMKMDVQRLGEISLKDAILLRANATAPESVEAKKDKTLDARQDSEAHGTAKLEGNVDQPFLAPAQLKQSYIVSPAKQRLVTLNALLKRTFARKGAMKKAIVFVSCADSVDFHFEVFARNEQASDGTAPVRLSTANSGAKHDKEASPEVQCKDISRKRPGKLRGQHPRDPKATKENPYLPTIAHPQTLRTLANPNIRLFKLHGSLPQNIRFSTLSAFSKSSDASILFCTDVASRGLDLPNIDLVIEYDPSFSSDDHLHRVGRTARAGREGKAICFLMPGPEESYIRILKSAAGKGTVKGETAEEVLRRGFAVTAEDVGKGPKKWDERATEWQLDVERWVVGDSWAGELAKKAYVSHVRAYATHVAKERGIFDVKGLHLGHLAKAFALREKPGSMGHGKAEKGGSNQRVPQGEKRRLEQEDKGGEHASKMRDENHENVKLDWRKESAVPASGKDAADMMRAKMKEHMAIAREFNIG